MGDSELLSCERKFHKLQHQQKYFPSIRDVPKDALDVLKCDGRKSCIEHYAWHRKILFRSRHKYWKDRLRRKLALEVIRIMILYGLKNHWHKVEKKILNEKRKSFCLILVTLIEFLWNTKIWAEQKFKHSSHPDAFVSDRFICFDAIRNCVGLRKDLPT